MSYTVPPCPNWCTETAADHRIEYEPLVGVLERDHTMDIGHASILQHERCEAGRVERSPAMIQNWVPEHEELTADQARQVAADMLAAAAKLKEIFG